MEAFKVVDNVSTQSTVSADESSSQSPGEACAIMDVISGKVRTISLDHRLDF